MDPIAHYILAVTPASLVLVMLLVLVPKELTIPRIMLHILFFVLVRDAMTGSGFWQLNEGAVRIVAAPTTLLILSALSCLLFVSAFALERQARQGMRFFSPNIVISAAIGIGGAFLISFVAAVFKHAFSLPSLPEPEPTLIPAILVFALAGNAYEELLFRGMLQNTLSKTLSPTRAALISAAFFCFCHASLATTVTHVGTPIFVFTMIEGLVAAFVYRYAGLLGATLAHGLAIFIIALGFY